MIQQTQQGKGPVGVKKTPRKRLAAMGRPATKGSFTKKNPRPGPGRPRGVPNKFSGELKEAILAGVNGSHPLGVSGFVLKLSIETPTSAAACWGGLFLPRWWARWVGRSWWCTGTRRRRILSR